MFKSTFTKFMIIAFILMLSFYFSRMCLYNQSYVIEGVQNMDYFVLNYDFNFEENGKKKGDSRMFFSVE